MNLVEESVSKLYFLPLILIGIDRLNLKLTISKQKNISIYNTFLIKKNYLKRNYLSN